MKLLLTFLQKYKDILFLLLLSLTPILWYGLDTNKLIASHDVGYPFNPFELVKDRIFAWSEGIDFGVSQIGYTGTILFHGLEAVFTFLTHSLFLGQKIYAIMWFFLPMVAMYYLVKKLAVFNEKPYLGILAAILYQFNFFQLQGWVTFWRTRFSVYVALPLILVFLVDFLEGRRKLFKTSILIGLTFFFLNTGGSPPLFGSVTLLALVVIGFYFLLNTSNWRAYLKKILLLILGILVINLLLSAYWVIPYLSFILSSYSSTISSGGGLESMLGWTDVISRNASPLNLLRLQGLDFMEINNVNDDIKIFLTNPILIAISFILPILAFGAIIWAKKLEKKYILLISLLLVVAIVFTAASHAPFREFYIFLLNVVPGFPIFRTALYKFGGLLWFSYAILIAFSLSSIIETIKTKLQNRETGLTKIPGILASLFIFFILAFNFPIFSNRLFAWNPPLTTLEKIPQYVFDFGKWIDKQNISERTLLLPKLNDTWHADAFKWEYWSLNPVTAFLTRKNFIANDGSLVGSEMFLLNDLYKNLENNNSSWQKLAGMLGIKYLLLRNDFFSNLNWSPSTSPSVYQKILGESGEVEKMQTFGEWEFYRIKKDPYKKVYLPEEVISYSAQDEDIPKILSLSFETINKDKEIVLLQQKDANIFKSSSQNAIVVVPGPAKFSLPVEKGKLVVPNPKFMPGSPFYFLTENKEKELVQNTKDEKQLIDAYLGLSLKRLGELNQMINSDYNVQELSQVLDRYSVLWGEINKTYQSLRANKNQSTNTLVPRLRSYIWEERNFLAELINKQKNEMTKSSLKNTYKNLGDLFRTIRAEDEKEIPLSEYEQAYYDPNIVLLTSGYKWEMPQDGKYGIFLANSSILTNSQEVKIDIEDKEVIGMIETQEPTTNWQKIGEIELNKGEHGLKITANGIPVYSFKRGDIIVHKVQSSKFKVQKAEVKINYTRLNPTRYKVEVNSNGQPLTLVFNERFDKDWKVYIKDVRDKRYDLRSDLGKRKDKGLISDFLSLKSYILNLLDENMFNTLFLKPLPETNHIKVNGYANAWRIDSKQITDNRQQKYELIIEYWPQRLLWLGYSVSAVTVLGSIIYLVITKRRKVIK